MEILRAGADLFHRAPECRAEVFGVHRLAERGRGALCRLELSIAGIGEALHELRMGVVAGRLRLAGIIRRGLDTVGRAIDEARSGLVGEVGPGLLPIGDALCQARLLIGREALPGRVDARHGVGMGCVQPVLGRLRRGVDGVHARRDHLSGPEHVGLLADHPARPRPGHRTAPGRCR